MSQEHLYPTVYEVLRTPTSKWKWWPALQVVDCYPINKRKPSITVNLSAQQNNAKIAVFMALKEELKLRQKEED